MRACPIRCCSRRPHGNGSVCNPSVRQPCFFTHLLLPSSSVRAAHVGVRVDSTKLSRAMMVRGSGAPRHSGSALHGRHGGGRYMLECAAADEVGDRGSTAPGREGAKVRKCQSAKGGKYESEQAGRRAGVKARSVFVSQASGSHLTGRGISPRHPCSYPAARGLSGQQERLVLLATPPSPAPVALSPPLRRGFRIHASPVAGGRRIAGGVFRSVRQHEV